MENTVGLTLGAVGIAVTLGLGVYIHWRTSKTLLAIFWLVSSLPGGDVAARIYEDIRKTKQVRGIPYRTKNDTWAIAWSMPPYKEKAPKP